jgi:hypothetical protein
MRNNDFISNSCQEKPATDAACAVIEATGIRCRTALPNIIPGVDWTNATAGTISQGCIMMLVFHV